MSVMSQLNMEVMDQIELGRLSWAEIAIRYNLNYDDVVELAAELRSSYVDPWEPTADCSDSMGFDLEDDDIFDCAY